MTTATGNAHHAAMFVATLFWLLLPIPGLAWLVRTDPGSCDDGALSMLARAYFASFALLSPFAIAGYVLHTPLSMFTTATLVGIAAGAWTLARGPRPIWKRATHAWIAPIPLALITLAWMAFDFVVGARVGGHIQGDAGFHIARVRMLCEIGMGSWDPLVGGLQFEPVYHTNLYHALIAASAQVARIDPGAAWIALWPITKLITAATGYELGLRALGDKRCAYACALTASGLAFTQTHLVLPNMLACNALVPFGVAAALHAARPAARVRDAFWVLAAGLVLAQTHMLYALFYGLLVWPLLLGRFVVALSRKSGRGAALSALGVSVVAVPWLVVPAWPRIVKLVSSVAHAAGAQIALGLPLAVTADPKRKMFVDVGDGLVRLQFTDFVGWGRPVTQLAIAVGVLVVLSRGREVRGLVAVLVSIGVYLFVPRVCSILFTVLEVPWIFGRFVTACKVMCLILAPGGIAVVVVRLLAYAPLGRVPNAWVNGAAGVMALGLASAYVVTFAARGEPWTLAATWQGVREGRASSTAADVSRRARFFHRMIPERVAVMAPLWMDYYLPMHCNCYAFAFRAGRGSRKLGDIGERRAAVERFYDHRTPARERVEMLERYGLGFVYSSARRLPRFVREFGGRVKGSAGEGVDGVVEVR